MNLGEYAASHGLKRIGSRPRFSAYMSEAWSRRSFAWAFSAYTSEALHARTRLGKWWIVLMPTFIAAIYGLIFGIILGPTSPENFIAFLLPGVFLFSFMSGTLLSGASSVTGNEGLVRSLSFPKILLPISSVLQQLIILRAQLSLLVLTLLLAAVDWRTLKFENPITAEWLLFPLVVVLMIMFSSGIAMIASRLTAQFRDVGKLVPIFVRVAFYVSGVFYSLDKAFAHMPGLLAVFELNPFYDFIQLSRGLLVAGYEPTEKLWVLCILWAIVTPVIGMIFFWQAEEVYGRDD